MDNKLYEVVSIDKEKSGSFENQLTGKEDHYIVCNMAEVSSREHAGRKIFSGDSIGYAFTSQDDKGWIPLLQKAMEDESKIKELPLFEGFIHDVPVEPHFQKRKNEKGELEIVTFQTGDDEGKPIIFNRFRLLLKAGKNPDIEVENYMNSSRIVKLKKATAEGIAIPDYKNEKANTILETWKLDATQPAENKEPEGETAE